jgi:hypothetical protein
MKILQAADNTGIRSVKKKNCLKQQRLAMSLGQFKRFFRLSGFNNA